IFPPSQPPIGGSRLSPGMRFFCFTPSPHPPRPLGVLRVLCVRELIFSEGVTMRLQNKVGIVTAAASGMGRAGALRFAKEGAAVGVADLDEAGVNAVVGEITAAGGRA